MRLRALVLLTLLAVAGCGDEGIDYDLRTPPPYVGAAPVAPPGQEIVDRQMTVGDADRLRPVIADWAAAVRTGDVARAAGFFTLPSIVQPEAGGAPLAMNSPQVAEAFNASLPCGAKLLATNAEGRYVIGTFVLVDVSTRPCRDDGDLARVGFVFGDKAHPRQFSEWWQLPTTPDEKGAPAARPKRTTAAVVSDFG